MTGPWGNSEICFPSTLNVPLGFASGTLGILGKQNSLFPLGPVIRSLFISLELKHIGQDDKATDNNKKKTIIVEMTIIL